MHSSSTIVLLNELLSSVKYPNKTIVWPSLGWNAATGLLFSAGTVTGTGLAACQLWHQGFKSPPIAVVIVRYSFLRHVMLFVFMYNIAAISCYSSFQLRYQRILRYIAEPQSPLFKTLYATRQGFVDKGLDSINAVRWTGLPRISMDFPPEQYSILENPDGFLLHVTGCSPLLCRRPVLVLVADKAGSCSWNPSCPSLCCPQGSLKINLIAMVNVTSNAVIKVINQHCDVVELENDLQYNNNPAC